MPLRLALLGDSIAYGTGAARADDTLAPRLAAALSEAGVPAEPAVFAVPGARSADLGSQVARVVAWQPDVAVVVIGANDLTAQTPAARAAADLGRAVASLRSAGAEVVVLPAPDLSVLAHVPPAARGLVHLASAVLRSAQGQAVRAAGGRVADPGPGTAAAFADDPAMFSADRFHPSSRGYAVIAQALAPAVRAAAGAAPRRGTAPGEEGG